MAGFVTVVVIGGGVAGLTVTHDLARSGVRVVLLEASDRLGGLLRRGTVAGVDIDLGAESFATRTDAVPRLIADAALPLDLVTPEPGGAALVVEDASAPDGVARGPLPRRTVLGIPADPLASDVVALIGADAATRAARERELPAFDAASAFEPPLYDLVAARLGPVIADRLVDTLCRSIYSRSAHDARLSDLHPGLWRALCATGWLTDAAAQLAAQAPAGSAVGGIAGGMWQLPITLGRAAQQHGAVIRTGVAAQRISGDSHATSGDDDALVVETADGPLPARRVVVATGARGAAALRPGLRADGGAGSVADTVRVVAAAIDRPDLTALPVGSGVIVDPAVRSGAKALTQTTAKWAWTRAATPAGRHLVRLSARDAGDGGLDTPTAIAREVTLLTGVPIAPGDVVDIAVQEWTDAVAAAPVPNAVRADAARGIHHTGAAVAGTGLASVIPHARALAARLAGELAVPSAHPTRSHA
ncbi:MAG: FAD-dependent oxidoreductase [Microbacterium sp.]|uniref:protoporphyrinogen/coproporphyrinogen oxidase n=1 Tax=Microbacterium sp. TaxID=51671 RepID=UPI001AD5FFEF|nr:FAD-dependent oxidoreductase [Microbacterium sp.]MBN9175856.1 FAD-dependent oxidoreductase [Microbacterium sp.]